MQSDVWSLGLSILETAEGSYPYPPEKYNSVFAQLSAIVGNPPPSLPDSYSEDARAFVALCLLKDAKERPTYKALLVCVFLFKQADVGKRSTTNTKFFASSGARIFDEIRREGSRHEGLGC